MQATRGADQQFWEGAIRRLSHRIHLGWWLDSWLGLLVPVTLIGAVAILALRWWHGNLSDQWLGATLGAVALFTMLVAWLAIRGKREPLDATRVRLEDALSMKARLTAAAAGVGAWPSKIEPLPFPLTFHPGRRLKMTLVGLVMVTAALWVPISQRVAVPPRVIEKPSALRDVEDWLESARRREAIRDESAKEIEERIAKLLERPAQNWYEHASLEAADHLRDLTAQDFRKLAQNLTDAQRAASALAAATSGMGLPQAAREALEKQLQQAAQDMQTGGLQPNSELLDQLRGLDPSLLDNFSAEQLRELAERLSQNSEALSQALQNMPSLDLSGIPRGAPGEGEGEGQGEGEGEGNGQPGRGGVTRGPGTAPMTLADQDTQLGTEKIEALKAPLDLERLAMGDALNVTDGAAKVDPSTYLGPQQGGAVQHAGDGGAAVWQNSLLPTERETLKRFFK